MFALANLVGLIAASSDDRDEKPGLEKISL
jgi:hypothetical protein